MTCRLSTSLLIEKHCAVATLPVLASHQQLGHLFHLSLTSVTVF